MEQIPQDSTQPAATSVKKGDETMWAAFCHLGGLIGLAVFPGNVVIPLIIYLVYRDRYPFVNEHGKEALNFQISMTIYFIAATILVFLVVGIFLIIPLFIFDIVVSIVAAIKAGQGESYRYPLTIRFLN